MSYQIDCPRCGGIVIVPQGVAENVTCPYCRRFLLSVDRRTGAIWRQRPGMPWWVRPAGVALIQVGIGGFLASLWIADHKLGAQYGTTFLAAFSNPLFFVGVPLGIFLVMQKRDA